MAGKYLMMTFQTLGGTPSRRQAEGMTMQWTALADAAIRELFPGIRLRSLWRGEGGASAHVLDIEPGARWEGIDVHEPGPEEVYVVSGVFNDGVRDYPAGSFIHAPAGSSHIPQSETGCTLFLFYPEG
jgi:anti-sigma factor ChrR (cupin superfamily)